MVSDDLKLKGGFNVPKGRSKRWLRNTITWSTTAFVVSVLTLGVYMETFAAPPEPEQVAVQYATNFSIIKAEGRESDQVYVTYMKKDCFLSGVHSAVHSITKLGRNQP